jgi:hypothetical protein
MIRLLPRRSAVLLFVLALGAWQAGALDAAAQERSLTAERTVDFVTGRSIPLDVKVADVTVRSIEFSNRGRPSGGFTGLMRSSVPETSTVLRAHLVAENPTADEWEVTFTLDFLDKAGALIDRTTHKSSWEGEAKATDSDHAILSYVVPQIAKVRIRMVARLD